MRGSGFSQDNRRFDKDVAAEGKFLPTIEDVSVTDKIDKVLKEERLTEETEVLSLCRNANYVEPLRVSMYLQTKPWVNSARGWMEHVAEFNKP